MAKRSSGIRTFLSTGAAYDACMTDKALKTGRIFVVPSEKVVGISWAWPIAVTKAHGELHTTTSDPRSWSEKDAAPKIAKATPKALAEANRRGWVIAPWAKGSANKSPKGQRTTQKHSAPVARVIERMNNWPSVARFGIAKLAPGDNRPNSIRFHFTDDRPGFILTTRQLAELRKASPRFRAMVKRYVRDQNAHRNDPDSWGWNDPGYSDSESRLWEDVEAKSYARQNPGRLARKPACKTVAFKTRAGKRISFKSCK